MSEGTVESYSKEEGYGWISVEGQERVWVHFSGITPDEARFPSDSEKGTSGFRFLEPSQRVTFDIAPNQHGDDGARMAINVRVLGL